MSLAKRLQPKTSVLLNAEQQLAVALAVQVEMKKRSKHLVENQSEKCGLKWCG